MKRMYFWMMLILIAWGCEKQEHEEGAKERESEKMSPIEELIKKADTGQPEKLSFELEAQQGSLRRNLFENEPLLFCRRIGSLTKQGLSLSTLLVRQTCMEQDRIQIRLDEAEAKARDWEDRINKVEVNHWFHKS